MLCNRFCTTILKLLYLLMSETVGMKKYKCHISSAVSPCITTRSHVKVIDHSGSRSLRHKSKHILGPNSRASYVGYTAHKLISFDLPQNIG